MRLSRELGQRSRRAGRAASGRRRGRHADDEQSCCAESPVATNCSRSSDAASAACRSSRKKRSGWAAGGVLRRNLRRGVEEAEARAFRLDRDGVGKLRQDFAQLGKQLHELDRAAVRRGAPGAASGGRPAGRSHAATAPTANTPARRRLPSSGRRGRGRPATAPAGSAPRPGGSCRSRARPRASRRLPAPARAASRPATSSASSASRPTNAARCGAAPAVSSDVVPASSAGSCGEDRLLELAQPRDQARCRGSRLKRAPCLTVGLERLGLPAGAVQREHQLRPQRLAQGVLFDEELELAHELRVPPEPRGASRSSSSMQARRKSSRREISPWAKSLVREVGEWRPSPQCQCAISEAFGCSGVSRGEGGATGGQAVERIGRRRRRRLQPQFRSPPPPGLEHARRPALFGAVRYVT